MNPIELNNNEAVSAANYWRGELQKCMEDQYYFYANYCLIDGEKPKISREEYYERLNFYKNKTNPWKKH